MDLLSFYPKEFIQVVMLSKEIKYVDDFTVNLMVPSLYLSVCMHILSKCKDYEIMKIEKVDYKHAILNLRIDYSSTLIEEMMCLCEELKKMGIRIKLKY